MYPYLEYFYFSVLLESNFILSSLLPLHPLPPVVLSDSLRQVYFAGYCQLLFSPHDLVQIQAV